MKDKESVTCNDIIESETCHDMIETVGHVII